MDTVIQTIAESRKQKPFDPTAFMKQFEFKCKYNKNYNRNQDCTDYQLEISKEIVTEFERQKNTIQHLEKDKSICLKEIESLKNQIARDKEMHNAQVWTLED